MGKEKEIKDLQLGVSKEPLEARVGLLVARLQAHFGAGDENKEESAKDWKYVIYARQSTDKKSKKQERSFSAKK
jgi:hypothetical protein